MSFFFQKKKHEPKKVTQKPNSKETLNRLGCQVCPLNKADNKSPKMKPDLAEETEIYILGEQPTEGDDKDGSPYHKMAADILGDTRSVSFDNVIRDFDPSGKATPWIAMECCRPLLTSSISKSKPKFIVGLGIWPLQWFLGSSDMVGLRGRTFAVSVGGHSCYFMPTYSPQEIVKWAFDKHAPLKSKLGHCLKFDLLKAQRLARTLPPPTIDAFSDVRAALQTFDGSAATQLAPLKKLISEACKAPEKAIDLETSRLRPYAKGARILTAAISYGDTNFSFALDHPKAGWTPSAKADLCDVLCDLLLSEGSIIAHNTPFECEWLIHKFTKDIINHRAWECTMMQAHFLDERRGKRGGNDDQFQPNPYQALDFLVRQYFGISYKPLFKLDRKNMAAADLQETLLYNCADTKYTLRLFRVQSHLLREAGLWKAYKEAVARQPTVAIMQSVGIAVDQDANRKMSAKLGAEIQAIEADIQALPEVQRFIADRKSFNPASQPELIKLLKDYCGVKQEILRDGKETTDKSALNKITHPIGKLVENYRNRSKLKSTYVDVFSLDRQGAFIFPDKRIHPSFNTTFAETGRTSSDEPNQQNWPSRNDKWVRKQIVAGKGHVLLAFDYGQLEACTAAMCTKDKVLVEALWNEYDIHMKWAEKAAYVWPEFIGGLKNLKDKAVMKEFRSRIKNKLVFPVIFGASNKSVAGYLNAPQDKIDKLMNEFWRTFHGIDKWQRKVMNDYYDCGFVSSPTGRRRHYPLTKNQAVNYPIQSVACDIVCRAMVRLSMRALDMDVDYLQPVMNIHDDLTFCIPDDDKIIEDSINIISKEMLNPGYDFINVPLSVSCSVGPNWLDMDEVGKFWSNK